MSTGTKSLTSYSNKPSIKIVMYKHDALITTIPWTS